MNEFQKNVIALIEGQQKGKENTAPWMVGEQLKEIALNEPNSAELLAHDLTVKEMSIEAAEKKIAEYAAKHKPSAKAPCSVVTPIVAEGILREFYGLPGRDQEPTEAPKEATTIIKLEDLF